jgi:hypothetical protein
VNRLLALPAVACVVLAAVLGTMGWSSREESRQRAATEDARREAEALLGPGVTGDYRPDEDFLRVQACDSLLRAAALDRTVGAGSSGPLVPVDPTDPTAPTAPFDPTVTLPPQEAAVALRNMLDPIVVIGLPGLDEPAVLEPMARLRDQIDAALAVDHDPFASPNVQAAAQELGTVVSERCF